MSFLSNKVDTLLKKHKKHKTDRREKYDASVDKPPGLKLILKVGGQGKLL